MIADNIVTIIVAVVSAGLGGLITALGNRRKTSAETVTLLDKLNDTVLERTKKLLDEQSKRIDGLLERIRALEKQEEQHGRQRRYLEDMLQICIGYVKSLQTRLAANGVQYDEMPPELQAWLDEYYKNRNE